MILERVPCILASALGQPQGVWDLVADAGLVVKLVLLLLMVMSAFSWAIIFGKYFRLRKMRADTRVFLDRFWASESFDDIYRALKREGNQSPLARVFRAAYKELVNLRSARGEEFSPEEGEETGESVTLSSVGGGLESLTRVMRRTSLEEIARLERLIPFLATTGSSAPFIGLFGTVWGIMTSFLDISRIKSADISVVAPGISEALIATAVGLFAAIPAVIGYNYFVVRVRGLAKELDGFSDDLLNIVQRHVS